MNTNRLLEKIHDRIKQHCDANHRVQAIRFYHESAIVPLNEAKEYVEAIHLGQFIEIHPGTKEYLEYLEGRDLIGAAACLCFHFGHSSQDAIAATERSASLLGLPTNVLHSENGSGNSPSAKIESIILERAIAISREKAIRNLMKQSGTTREMAEQIFDKFSSPDESSPPPLEPETRQAVPARDEVPPIHRPMLAPVPSPATQTSKTSKYLATSARLVALVYGIAAIAGLIVLIYSFQTSPRQFQRLSLPEDLPDDQQSTILKTWSNENIPSTLAWFFPIDRYIDQRMEPGLPSDYSFLDTDWDKKLERFNQSATAAILAFHRCQQMVLIFYGTALLLAVWYGRQPNLVAAISMGFLGAMGLAPMVFRSFQWDLQNGLWLVPLLIPGMMAIGISLTEILMVPTQSERRLHVRGLWIGIFALIVSSVALGWAILSHGHLRANAGVGVLASILLILHHAWHYAHSFKKVSA